MNGFPFISSSVKLWTCEVSGASSSRRSTIDCAFCGSIPGSSAKISGGAVFTLMRPSRMSPSFSVILSIIPMNSCCVNIFTSLIASMFWKSPCESRWSTMRSAMPSSTPCKDCKVSTSAVLILTCPLSPCDCCGCPCPGGLFPCGVLVSSSSFASPPASSVVSWSCMLLKSSSETACTSRSEANLSKSRCWISDSASACENTGWFCCVLICVSSFASAVLTSTSGSPFGSVLASTE